MREVELLGAAEWSAGEWSQPEGKQSRDEQGQITGFTAEPLETQASLVNESSLLKIPLLILSSLYILQTLKRENISSSYQKIN